MWLQAGKILLAADDTLNSGLLVQNRKLQGSE